MKRKRRFNGTVLSLLATFAVLLACESAPTSPCPSVKGANWTFDITVTRRASTCDGRKAVQEIAALPCDWAQTGCTAAVSCGDDTRWDVKVTTDGRSFSGIGSSSNVANCERLEYAVTGRR
mgnify:CR=1 FL=1